MSSARAGQGRAGNAGEESCQAQRESGLASAGVSGGVSQQVHKEGWQLWRPALDYLASCDHQDLEALLEKATMTLEQEVGRPARLYRLCWTFLTKGIKAAKDCVQDDAQASATGVLPGVRQHGAVSVEGMPTSFLFDLKELDSTNCEEEVN
ncbi:hypothetical protein C0Q70_01190 [Pomacea canaliculata]|uniref:Uncharacterized protein n=1 Tax=Pomacea canaliculata TaxID=400727 RepID=A0A2T7PYS6_POMCA|nr:hypothetical protein C0Q70_01190 [Pomacea canaliculata]